MALRALTTDVTGLAVVAFDRDAGGRTCGCSRGGRGSRGSGNGVAAVALGVSSPAAAYSPRRQSGFTVAQGAEMGAPVAARCAGARGGGAAERTAVYGSVAAVARGERSLSPDPPLACPEPSCWAG